MKDLVRDVINAVNATQPGEPQSTDLDAPLLDGPYDSLGIVELLVRLEEATEKQYGTAPRLLGTPDVIREGGPLETVGSLVDYLREGTDG